MNFFSRMALAMIGGATPGLLTRASKAGRLISFQFAGQPVWTPKQYDKLAEESYQKNVVAFRAIHEISKNVGSVPFNLFRGSGTAREELDSHPLLRSQFMCDVSAYMLIAGNSWMEQVGPRGRPPSELWTKRPDRMRVVVGNRGIPEAYQFHISAGQTVTWPVNQLNGQSKILHMKSFHPTDDWYGMSPIEAAAFSIDQHNESGRWNMWRLQNDARPSGALVIDPKSATGLDDTEFQRLQAQIDSQMSGPEAAGRPLLLEGGLEWKQMGMGAVEMDWLEGRHTSARDVAMAFGMPPQMLGIPGDNTHRNMEEARLWLWEQTIIPMLDFILSELNWWLTPLFGKDLTLAFDLDEVPALITRRHILWDKVTNSDFLTIDEKREAVGYEDLTEVTEEELKKSPGKVVLVKKNTRQLGDRDAESTDPDGKDLNNPLLGTGKPNGTAKPNGKVTPDAAA
jgi:HK97 family phage portal protein